MKTEIFNFNTLKVHICSKTKTLFLQMIQPEPSKKNLINEELITELESLFSWLSQHIEVHSVVMTGQDEYFSKGFDLNEFINLPEKRFQELLEKYQKLVYVMFFLPQTIIANLQGGGVGTGLELAMGAEIRLAFKENYFSFDHLKQALVPSGGGIGFSTELIPNSFIRSWLLSPEPVDNQALKASGFIHTFLNKDEEEKTLSDILTNISKQAPVARIQTKRSLLEAILPGLDRTIIFEKKFALAGLAMNDWKKKINDSKKGTSQEFIKARDLSLLLKEEAPSKKENLQ